jgi:hypothetical protein
MHAKLEDCTSHGIFPVSAFNNVWKFRSLMRCLAEDRGGLDWFRDDRRSLQIGIATRTAASEAEEAMLVAAGVGFSGMEFGSESAVTLPRR